MEGEFKKMRDIIFTTVLFFLIGWFCILFVGNIDYSVRREAVGNVLYRYTQTAGKKGEMNEIIYKELQEKLHYYGEFEIALTAERFEKDKIITVENDAVIDLDLREEDYDILTIEIMSKRNHWLSRATELCPFLGKRIEYKITGSSAVYIQ